MVFGHMIVFNCDVVRFTNIFISEYYVKTTKKIPIPGLPPLSGPNTLSPFSRLLKYASLFKHNDWKNMHPFTLINELIMAT